jgi:hypothetical protein
MQSCLREIIDKMESRRGEVLDGRYAKPKGRVAVYTFYDNLDDGPSFNEEPSADPIIDAAPISDHAAFTTLKFTNRDPATDDLADSPVFDTNPVFHNDELVYDEEASSVITTTGIGVVFTEEYAILEELIFDDEPVLDEGPIFDEESNREEEEPNTDKVLSLGC